MIASLLFGLDSDLRGFKDQILASETLPTAANAYSRLLSSLLGQNSSVSFEFAALVSSSGGCGNSRGGFRGNHGGHGFCGGSRGSGRIGGCGDRKCDHCGGTSYTEPYCWVKYGKPDYVHQVIDDAPQTQSTSTSFGHATSSSGSCDALTT